MVESLGLYGPFKNPDDIKDYWYQFTEENLVEEIKQIKAEINLDKKELKRASKAEKEMWNKDLSIQKQDLPVREQKLKSLREFEENHERLLERYKFDKETLKQIQQDWHDYNDSLYFDWNNTQSLILAGRIPEGPQLKDIQRGTKSLRIKREEIGRRFKKLLSLPV